MRCWCWLGSSFVALAISGTAQAQEQDAPSTPTILPNQSAPASDQQGDGEIVITGSRISRPDYVAESPILSVGPEALAARGPSTLDATFNQLPQFAASNANSGSSPARQGRANANLRGLGIQRTLVLLDGRRTQPSDPLGAIDLNTIAPALIENVEVITGGASAVYGSDAIAGVVNVKLRRKFEGLELDAQYGITDRNDSEGLSLSATMGGSFDGGRGNIVASVGYFDRGGTFRGSRPFFEGSGIASALIGGAVTASGTNLPTQAALNAVFSKYGAGVPARNAAIGVNADGTLFTTAAPVLNLRDSPYSVVEGRVGFPLGEFIPLQTPITRYNAFVKGSYEISNDVEAYLQFNHVDYSSSYSRPGYSAGSVGPLATIPLTNPFVPADLRAIAASRPNPNAPLNFTFSTSRVGQTAYNFDNQVNEFLVGMRGKIPSLGWSWDVYGSYGSTITSERSSGFINIAAFRSLVEAADGGASICPGGFNPFQQASLDATPGQEACYDYLNRNLSERTTLKQAVVEGSLQGGLFALPAGDVRFAAGASYRRPSYSYAPDEQRVRSEVYPVQPTGPTSGNYNVKEVFLELFVPVLRDVPFIEELNLDAAYRYSDYSTIGGVSTYKGSVDWGVGEGFRVRGSYQRAIRAPSLGELFSPPERASAGVGSIALGGGDPCDVTSLFRSGPGAGNAAQVRALCVATGVPAGVVDIFRFAGSSVPGQASGNLNLKEETADTYTLGAVWQSKAASPMLKRLSASVDYYKVKVRDAIGTITAQVGLSRCFNGDGQSNPTYDPNNFFCSLTSRNVSGGIELQLQPTLNLAAYEVSGIDFQIDYGFKLDDIGVINGGDLSFNTVVSYLDSYKIQNLADAPFLDYAGTIGNAQVDPGATAFPRWKLNLSATYSIGPAQITATYRWYDKLTHYSDVGVPNPGRPGSAATDYVDLVGRVAITSDTQLRLGIQNLFDTQPPEWVGYGATDLGLYDLLQRRYFVGLRHRF